MINLELGQILTQALGFIILLYFLKRLAWERIMGTLEARRQRIVSQFSDAEKMRQEAEQIQKGYERRMREIEEAAQKRMQEAIQEGQRAGREIQEKAQENAKEESQQIRRQAQEEIERQREKAMKELQANIADLVIAVASKVIGKSLRQEDHLKLLDQFISEVKDQYGK